ncbi:MAG: copper resistance protein B, partial [Caulobacteraceae bacterium]|nr:copper resistance protein B [Caulobacter sp.]
DDPARGIGAGPSDLDAGLRLRYEISRKFAPYAGLTYERKFGRTADYARAEGERADDLRFTLGVRSWF